jgi:hypothetical protein
VFGHKQEISDGSVYPNVEIFKLGLPDKTDGEAPPPPQFLSTILRTCLNGKQLPIIFRVRYSVISSQILSYCLPKQIGKILEISFSNVDCTNFAKCLEKLVNSLMKKNPLSGTVCYFAIMCVQCNFYCKRKVAD